MDQLNSILSIPIISLIISITRIIFIIVSIVLFAGIIYLLVKTTWMRYRYFEEYTEFFASRPFGTKVKFRKMDSIQKKLDSGKEESYKLAVIEAEDYLKEVLQKMGYEGDLLSDILERVDSKVLPSANKVKDVQKIRNDIVYNPDYYISKDQAVNIVKIYEQALNELEAL